MARFQDEVGKKRAGEVDKVRTAALKVARYTQQIRKLTDDQLFNLFDTDSTGSISREGFLSFFATAEKVIRPFKAEAAADDNNGAEKAEAESKEEAEEVIELDPEDLTEVFATLCLEGESVLSKETFLQVMPLYMYVVK